MRHVAHLLRGVPVFDGLPDAPGGLGLPRPVVRVLLELRRDPQQRRDVHSLPEVAALGGDPVEQLGVDLARHVADGLLVEPHGGEDAALVRHYVRPHDPVEMHNCYLLPVNLFESRRLSRAGEGRTAGAALARLPSPLDPRERETFTPRRGVLFPFLGKTRVLAENFPPRENRENPRCASKRTEGKKSGNASFRPQGREAFPSGFFPPLTTPPSARSRPRPSSSRRAPWRGCAPSSPSRRGTRRRP